MDDLDLSMEYFFPGCTHMGVERDALFRLVFRNGAHRCIVCLLEGSEVASCPLDHYLLDDFSLDLDGADEKSGPRFRPGQPILREVPCQLRNSGENVFHQRANIDIEHGRYSNGAL